MNYTVILCHEAVDDVTLIAFPKDFDHVQLDERRKLTISTWSPSIAYGDATTVTVEGSILKEDDVPVDWDNWKAGDTEPPMKKLELPDGRVMQCRDWTVGPGHGVGDARTGSRDRSCGAKITATFFLLRVKEA